MTAPLIIAAIAGALALVAWGLRRRDAGRPLSRRAAAGIVSCAAALGLGYLAVVYFAPSWLRWRSPPSSPPPVYSLPEGDYPTGVLAIGSQTPPLEATGWLNGTPRVEHAKLTVIDLWSAWCPFCRATAPGLVRTYDKYAGRGVEFVSVTTMPEATSGSTTRRIVVRRPAPIRRAACSSV